MEYQYTPSINGRVKMCSLSHKTIVRYKNTHVEMVNYRVKNIQCVLTRKANSKDIFSDETSKNIFTVQNNNLYVKTNPLNSASQLFIFL